jgi:hypothetical protein
VFARNDNRRLACASPILTPEPAAIQREMFRRNTTEERLRMAFDMSAWVRNIARAGLRSRRPDLDENELSRELLRIMHALCHHSDARDCGCKSPEVLARPERFELPTY